MKRTITLEQFTKLPFSEAILWVVDDLDNFKEEGIHINMNTWILCEGK